MFACDEVADYLFYGRIFIQCFGNDKNVHNKITTGLLRKKKSSEFGDSSTFQLLHFKKLKIQFSFVLDLTWVAPDRVCSTVLSSRANCRTELSADKFLVFQLKDVWFFVLVNRFCSFLWPPVILDFTNPRITINHIIILGTPECQ